MHDVHACTSLCWLWDRTVSAGVLRNQCSPRLESGASPSAPQPGTRPLPPGSRLITNLHLVTWFCKRQGQPGLHTEAGILTHSICMWRELCWFLFWVGLFQTPECPVLVSQASKGPPQFARPLAPSGIFWKACFGMTHCCHPDNWGKCQQISNDFEYVRWNSTFSCRFKNPSDRQMKWDKCTSGHCLVNVAEPIRKNSSPPAAVKTNRKWKYSARVVNDLLGILASFESTVILLGK